MREIKFRAWDAELKEMTIVDDLYWFEEMGVHDGEGQGHYIKYDLMQFTGLKDRTGKDIYEGDILDGHSDGLVRVEWHDAKWICTFDDENSIGLDEAVIWFGNDMTIVGNIYQDTSLMYTKRNNG